MSTTFEVFPGTRSIPTFREVIHVATHRLYSFFENYGIAQRPEIVVTLSPSANNPGQTISLDQEMRWSEDDYAWFQLPPAPGGTDVYFHYQDDLTKEVWADYVEQLKQGELSKAQMEQCLAAGYYWVFRRSAGQPAVINLAYGYLAAAVAELTEGFIFSDDGAWEFSRFPAFATSFYRWYFRPEQADVMEMREWAERCIFHIPNELSA